MNYEFSRGNNGFVCWRSSRNDSHYKWKKRLARLQSAIIEMSGHFFASDVRPLNRTSVKCNPFTMWTYCNYNHNKIIRKLNSSTVCYYYVSLQPFLCRVVMLCRLSHFIINHTICISPAGDECAWHIADYATAHLMIVSYLLHSMKEKFWLNWTLWIFPAQPASKVLVGYRKVPYMIKENKILRICLTLPFIFCPKRFACASSG